MKNHSKLYKFIAVVSFIVSGYFTILLFKSTATTLWDKIPMITIAIVFELAKWSLLRESIIGNHAGWLKISIFCLWVVITSSSIVASAGYVINQTNASSNIAVQNSEQYNQALKAKDNQADLYNAKKAELNRLYNTKESRIKDLAKQRDSLSNKYISKKVQLSQQMNEIEQSYNSQIKNVSSELSGISSSLNTQIDTSKLQIKSESGYTALFSLSANIYNSFSKEKIAE